MRVLCAGHVNWDVTLRVDSLPGPDGEARILENHQSGGGSAANCASVLATLDLPVGILGSVGTDQHGWQARRELADAGVDTGLLVETAVGTATKYLIVDPDGEVMVLGNDRGNEAFDPDDAPADRVRGLDHLHLTSQRPSTAAELAAMAAEGGATVSFDPGRRVLDRDYGETLAVADVVFLTDREAPAAEIDIEDEDDLPEDRVVVFKHGAAGAEVRAPSGCYTHPGYDVEAVDTTGAGDAFAAGFIAALVEGWDPRSGDAARTSENGGIGGYDAADYERALVAANACGAIASRQTGARVRIARGDVDRFLRRRN